MKTILGIQGSQPANAKYINLVNKQIPITPLASHNQQPEIYIVENCFPLPWCFDTVNRFIIAI